MILIDTNVISELWKAKPDATLLEWIDEQAIQTLFLSAITVAELRYGIASMPEGKRRTLFRERLEHDVLPCFAGRVLAFDLDASKAYADLMVRARANGKPISNADGYIAGTAAAHQLMVATRDTGPFEAGGLVVINPWEASL
jgi:toxin FitB